MSFLNYNKEMMQKGLKITQFGKISSQQNVWGSAVCRHHIFVRYTLRILSWNLPEGTCRRSQKFSLLFTSGLFTRWSMTRPVYTARLVCITLTYAAPRAPGVSGHNSSSEIEGKMISLWLSLQILYFGYKALETVNSLKLDLWSWFLPYVCSLFNFRNLFDLSTCLVFCKWERGDLLFL